MPDVFDFDANLNGGTGAVYTVTAGNTADTAPLTAPVSSPANFSRVKFHTGLDYPKVISAFSSSITLPARTTGEEFAADHFIANHGRAGQPWVLGYATLQGQPIAFSGSLCVELCRVRQQGGGFTNGSLARWISLGANATSIIVHEYGVRTSDPLNASYSAITIPLGIFITDRLL